MKHSFAFPRSAARPEGHSQPASCLGALHAPAPPRSSTAPRPDTRQLPRPIITSPPRCPSPRCLAARRSRRICRARSRRTRRARGVRRRAAPRPCPRALSAPCAPRFRAARTRPPRPPPTSPARPAASHVAPSLLWPTARRPCQPAEPVPDTRVDPPCLHPTLAPPASCPACPHPHAVSRGRIAPIRKAACPSSTTCIWIQLASVSRETLVCLASASHAKCPLRAAALRAPRAPPSASRRPSRDRAPCVPPSAICPRPATRPTSRPLHLHRPPSALPAPSSASRGATTHALVASPPPSRSLTHDRSPARRHCLERNQTLECFT